MEVKIIVPDTSIMDLSLEGVIGSNLYHLTELLAAHGSKTNHGLFGGDWGYGAFYENDVFMMHPYCWCEKMECPWCRACECESVYTVDDKVVDFRGWMDMQDRTRIGVRITKQCEICADPKPNEPNFRIKDPLIEIHWYKYIGRGMKIPEGLTLEQWSTAFAAVIDSIEEPA